MSLLSLLICFTVMYVMDRLQFWFTELYYAKRCNYDCSSCKAWSCRYHSCSKRREETNS